MVSEQQFVQLSYKLTARALSHSNKVVMNSSLFTKREQGFDKAVDVLVKAHQRESKGEKKSTAHKAKEKTAKSTRERTFKKKEKANKRAKSALSKAKIAQRQRMNAKAMAKKVCNSPFSHY